MKKYKTIYFRRKYVQRKYVISSQKTLNINSLSKFFHFEVLTVSCMVDHVKPTMINHIMLYCILEEEKTVSQIARSITELAMFLKDNDNSFIVCGIVPRHDNLNNRATEVNNHLLPMCKE